MKNLKKVLCLALAFAMVLGLVVVGSAAQDVTTLKDWDEVANKDAATLLNAFEIMQGDDDGFRPLDNVKRTEAAKMISVAMWGGSNDVKLYASGNVGGYKDVVAGSWYMGYVNYMNVQQIMVGDEKGNFNPDGNVTGYELLKMCLVALGYNPTTEGLTGAGWDIRTMALAKKATANQSLIARTSVTDWGAPINRTNAAQVIANMLYRNAVHYDLTQAGNGSISSQLAEDGPFITAVLGATERTGILVANEAGSIANPNGIVATNARTTIDKTARFYAGQNATILVAIGTTNSGVTTYTYTNYNVKMADTTADDLGLPVKVYFNKAGSVVSTALVSATPIDLTFNAATHPTAPFAANNIENIISVVGAEPAIYVGDVTKGNNVYAADPNQKLVAYDTDGDGYAEVVRLTTYTQDLKPTSVVEDEKYGTVIMENKVTWNASRYTSTGSTVQKNATLASNCNFEIKDTTDRAVYTTSANCFGVTKLNGYVLTPVEGAITRTYNETAGGRTTYYAYIDGEKFTDETQGISLGQAGTFYTYADGKTIHTKELTSTAANTSNTYALVYDADYVRTTASQYGNDKVTVYVTAILPDGTAKQFEVASIIKVTAGAISTAAPTSAEFVMADQTSTTITSTMTVGPTGATVTVKGPFASGGLLEKVPNKTAAGRENLLVPYSLNADGTINLYQYFENDGITADRTPKALDAGDGTTATKANASALAASALTGNKAYVTSTTATYVQTAADATDGTEKWAVYTGATVPSYTLDSGKAPKFIVTKIGNDEVGIAYLKLELSEIVTGSFNAAAANGVLVVLETPSEQYVDNVKKQVTTAWNSETGKVETFVMDIGAAGTKDTVYRTFTAAAGFTNDITPAFASKNFGFITMFDGDTMRIASYDAAGAEAFSNFYGIDKEKTRFYEINGTESTEIKASDISVQANDAANKYETLVYDATSDGVADIVLVFAKTQTYAATADGGLKITAGVPTAFSSVKNVVSGTATRTDTNEYKVVYSGSAKKVGANTVGFDEDKYVIVLDFGSTNAGKNVVQTTKNETTGLSHTVAQLVTDGVILIQINDTYETATFTCNGITVKVDFTNVSWN